MSMPLRRLHHLNESINASNVPAQCTSLVRSARRLGSMRTKIPPQFLPITINSLQRSTLLAYAAISKTLISKRLCSIKITLIHHHCTSSSECGSTWLACDGPSLFIALKWFVQMICHAYYSEGLFEKGSVTLLRICRYTYSAE